MRTIEPDQAALSYGITTLHQQMDNGQYRFRLLKNDGTAYIRTESITRGAWESSHYHHHVMETYIVQNGWIAYAQFIEEQRKIRIFHAGESFTTEPHIIHNIYMPLQSVIHVVKHGDAWGTDRIQDEMTKRFDSLTEALTEEEIMNEVAKASENTSPRRDEERYSAEYRHFDSLIWQLPAWCTAIFLVTAVGTNSIAQAQFLTRATSLSTETFAAGFLGLMFLVILALSHALYRFRSHQTTLKGYFRTPPWKSASTYLQLVVTVEAFSLLFVVLMLLGTSSAFSLWVCVILTAALTIHREWRVRTIRAPDSQAT